MMTCYDPLTIMAALLMLAHHTTFIRTINLETNHGEERSQRGIALLNNNYSSFYAGNYPSCLIACISDPQCKSFNFWWPNLMCDLNNKTKHLAEAKFLSQDISSTYMGLMREPGKDLKSLVYKSCKEVDSSSGDGYYAIDPKSSGNLFTVYCDMATDGGGWTLIYRAIFQTSDEEIHPVTFVDNYRNISDYAKNQLVPVTVFNQLRQDMGFSQIRFYCYKKLVDRTIHIMTKGSLEGEMVIRYFTNSTERPASCGSFTVLPDDTSIASQQCSQWGFDSDWGKDQKWGTERNKGENRLHIETVIARLGSKHAFNTVPTFSLLHCDDHWDDSIQHSAGDTWLIFVR